MIPWICPENYDETKSKISKTKSKVAFGHLEVNGFSAHKGYVMEHGMDKSFFDRFEAVILDIFIHHQMMEKFSILEIHIKYIGMM